MRTRYVKASISSAALTALHNARAAAWKRENERLAKIIAKAKESK
jgi:hypothetical protein|tara:strand:- start:553 stop:687 length:135 start_codon:yes stop_codon:yes gene_type:complete